MYLLATDRKRLGVVVDGIAQIHIRIDTAGSKRIERFFKKAGVLFGGGTPVAVLPLLPRWMPATELAPDSEPAKYCYCSSIQVDQSWRPASHSSSSHVLSDRRVFLTQWQVTDTCEAIRQTLFRF